MTKEQLLERIRKLRPNKTEAAYRAVASDLYYSQEYSNPQELDKDAVILDRMFLAYNSKTKDMQKKVMAEDPASCPLCKMRMTPVMLDTERKAVWCNRHFVVYPYKD